MSPEGWQAWCDGMAALSQCRNVHAKHSGPGTFVHACRDDVIEPIVKETVALLGAGRCFFGSNFPIEKLWTDCGTLYRTFRGAIAQLDEAGQAAIPHDTAARLYRIRSTCASRGLVIASNVANDAVIPGWCVSTIPE